MAALPAPVGTYGAFYEFINSHILYGHAPVPMSPEEKKALTNIVDFTLQQIESGNVQQKTLQEKLDGYLIPIMENETRGAQFCSEFVQNILQQAKSSHQFSTLKGLKFERDRISDLFTDTVDILVKGKALRTYEDKAKLVGLHKMEQKIEPKEEKNEVEKKEAVKKELTAMMKNIHRGQEKDKTPPQKPPKPQTKPKK
jgi:hypothetical protein